MSNDAEPPIKLPSDKERASLEARTAAYQEQLFSPEGEAHLKYLTDERGLTEDWIKYFRLGAVLEPDGPDAMARGKIAIPYLRPNGPMSIRFRQGPGWDGGGPKYYQLPGTKLGLFNTQPIIAAGDTVAICEGEFDAMIATMCGIPTVGLPGVSSWKTHYIDIFKGFDRVLIMADHDDKGQGGKFAETLATYVPGPVIKLMPQGHDINSFFLESGAAALREWVGIK
ncbi:toprim domain-containing protein [Glutamicibacter arilaitensis]|uniref:toprim domain-containing protein n=1 Tax=Glutamicibacter arilaitensis TaxID=256701 RepID=UPI003F9329D4